MIRNWLTAVTPEIVWHPASSNEPASETTAAAISAGSDKGVDRTGVGIRFDPAPHRSLETISEFSPEMCIHRSVMNS
jgi:hypothetical protein